MKYIVFFLICIIYFLGFLLDYPYPRIIAAITLLLSVVFVWKSRNSYVNFIISSAILYCNWSILYVNYFHKINSMFTGLYQTFFWSEGIYVLLLFMGSLVFFTDGCDEKNSFLKIQSQYSEEATSRLLIFFLLIVLILICVFGFGRPSVDGERGSPSAIYEYAIILFIACFWFSKRIETDILIVFVLSLFCIQNFYFGGRITGLQLLLVLFFMRYPKVLGIKELILFVMPLFFVMTIIGDYRGDRDGFELYDMFINLIDNGFSLDTAYSSYFTSLTFLIYQEMVTIEERMIMFLQWICYTLLGGALYGEQNLSLLTREIEFHYGGGVLPFYFYFYLGPLGVVAIAGYVSILLNYVNRNIQSSRTAFFIGIYLMVTCLRWYLYSPSQITRALLLMLFFLFVINVFDGVLKNNKYKA